jgi:adenine deaminase
LLLGTDTYKPNVIPGFSLHEELRYFVEAGLSPYDAIRAGTSDAARFLHRDDEFGTVAVGRRADLLLLSANPLDNVGNTSKRVGVMLRGNWLPEEQLQKNLWRNASQCPACHRRPSSERTSAQGIARTAGHCGDPDPENGRRRERVNGGTFSSAPAPFSPSRERSPYLTMLTTYDTTR